MFTELPVRCDEKTPKTPFAKLRGEVATALKARPRTATGRVDGFTFEDLGIAVSVTFDEDSYPTTARVRVSDLARIGHVSEVFKTFLALGWAL